MRTNQERFPALDGLRGYFVLLTFMVHFIASGAGFSGINYLPRESRTLVEAFAGWLQFSNYGVYGFFILSAFLIGRMVQSRKFNGILNFWGHRFLRIYPAFFISLLVSGGIGLFYTKYMQITFVQAVQNLFFLNGFFLLGEIPSLNFVTWSLFLEVLFYLTVPAILFIQRKYPVDRGLRLFLLFAGTAVLTFFLKLTSIYILFFGGLALAQFDDEELKQFASKMPESMVVLFYLFTTTIYSFGILAGETFIFFFLVSGTMLITKANFDNQSFLHRLFTMAWLRRVGQISYSFYLLHACIIAAYFYFLTGAYPDGPKKRLAFFAFPITLTATLVASVILYWIAERPYFLKKSAAKPPEVATLT